MMATKKQITFDRDASQALKGIAICLMLLHHCFRQVKVFKEYAISCYPFSQELVVKVADMGKICVSLYAFISGYGLYLNYKKNRNKVTDTKWFLVRYIKTFSGYWLIWVLSAAITQSIDGRVWEKFGSDNFWDTSLEMLIDFFGLAKLFHVPTLNGAWWYMSAAFVFLLVTPFIVKRDDHIILILLGVVVFTRLITGENGEEVFTGKNSPWAFLVPFILGMIFAKYRIIDRIANKKGKVLRFFVEIVLVVLAYSAYREIEVTYFWELKWGIIPMIIILFSVEYIIPIPGIKQILLFLGKHSLNIFLVHTFIRGYYMKDFVYGWKHFILIIVVLFGISLVISMILEAGKRVTGYNKFIDKMCGKIMNA